MKPRSLHCSVCGHRAESIFCALAGAHLEKLEREKTVHKYEKGQVIFWEGTPAFAIHCLYSGRVKIYKTGPKGDPIVIRLLGPGEIFGYRAVLSNEPCAATVEAVETSVICSISKRTLFDLLKQSPELTMRLLSKLAVELKTSEEQMLAIAQETVRQRTARLLLFLAEGNQQVTRLARTLKVPLLRSEMAQMVGTTPETFSRTLRFLASKGILQVTKDQISITNTKALEKIAIL